MSDEQAVFIDLDGTSLPDEVYEQHDLATLEDELIAILDRGGLGELDGNEFGPMTTRIYLYGASADSLFNGIEVALRAHPLCQNAKVVIRSGGPGAATTEVVIPMKR